MDSEIQIGLTIASVQGWNDPIDESASNGDGQKLDHQLGVRILPWHTWCNSLLARLAMIVIATMKTRPSPVDMVVSYGSPAAVGKGSPQQSSSGYPI